MHLSGIPHTAGNYAPQATYEGDNNVLCLQTARYLLKALRAAAAGKKPVGQTAYLGEPLRTSSTLASSTGSALRATAPLRAAFEHRAARLVRQAAERMASAKLSDEAGFQVFMVDWIKAAKAHCAYVVLDNFAQGVADAPGHCSTAACAALHRLLALHALTGIEDDLGDFLEDGFLSATQVGTALSGRRAGVSGGRCG
jgi:acyl-CoA oxidase